MSVCLSVCLSVALFIQHANRMCRVILPSWPVWVCLFFSFKNSVINGAIFGETNCEHKMYVLITSTNLSENILLVRKLQRDIIINVCRVPWRVPHFFSDFHETWIFSADFRKLFKYQASWKSIRWGPSCSMRTDSQTDRQTDMKRNSCFSQVCGKHQVTRLRTRRCDALICFFPNFESFERITWLLS